MTTGSGQDEVIGDDFANILSTGGGVDYVFGEGGADTIFGGSALDVLEGGAGNDTVYGEDGNDSLTGNEGNDVLDGGTGNDQLDGGVGGVDLLTGGAGTDSFFFRPGDSGVKLGTRDVITDFDPAENDVIELHFFDGLEFIGTDPFTAENQLRSTQNGGNTYVKISTDPDAAVEMTIELSGIINLTENDFLL